jgi:hypothetical protein
VICISHPVQPDPLVACHKCLLSLPRAGLKPAAKGDTVYNVSQI